MMIKVTLTIILKLYCLCLRMEWDKLMKIMSYNIHHGVGLDGDLNLERIATVIKNSNASIIGIQEVDRFYGERSDFQDQAKELALLLDYNYCYGANVEKPSEHSEIDKGQYGVAILSKYPIIEERHMLLNSFGEEQRGVLTAKIAVYDKELYVYNTHLGLDTKSRVSQVNELIELTKQHSGPNILVGDFNTEPESEEFQLLLQQTDLIDSFQNIKDAHTFPVLNPHKRIDFILTSSTLENAEQTVIHSEASDHLPIVTTCHFSE